MVYIIRVNILFVLSSTGIQSEHLPPDTGIDVELHPYYIYLFSEYN